MSKTGIAAGVLWAVVVGLLVAAWAVMLIFDDRYWKTAALLALTGCATSALAATLHIKTYACRVSQLVRATTLRGDGTELRPMR